MFDTMYDDKAVVDILIRLLEGDTVEQVSEVYDSRSVKIRKVFEKGFEQLRKPEIIALANQANDPPPKAMGWSMSHARPHKAFWLRQLKRFEIYNASIFRRNSIITVKFDKDDTDVVLRVLVDFNYLDKIEEYKKLISDKKARSRFLAFHDWLIAKGLAKAFLPSFGVTYGDFEDDTVFIVKSIEKQEK